MNEELQSYQRLAEAALQHYPIEPADITFIHHNAGIVFRVSTNETHQHYMLKIHKRVGIGGNPTAEEIEPGLHWLAAFAQVNDVTVQIPVRTNSGQYVAQIVVPSEATPVACTLQHWVDGKLPNGDFTSQHIHALGRMTAKLHAFSSTYAFDRNIAATHHNIHALHTNVRLLRTTLPEQLLSSQDYTIVLAAERRIVECITALGRSPDVWGPVHGDIHYGNVLLYDEQVRPIDFTGLRLTHYLYDIGVTMYHVFYQDSEIRRSYFSGYQELYTLPEAYQNYIEAFIAYVAIDNLAWNCTISEQRESSLFQQNMDDLINLYCTSIAEQQHFLFE